ncbi:exopolysaccharide biosynthesis protein [Pseudoblastomonas halimionae]|uniref:Exopolysaccharide biosynthesis protein n=1 Tax=Alteriqipengyuania halimionae TaxID=1926630 RepID=A0A6I4U321_9SPHN|nr:exopolysaccharide biosynthesis protein [Alteriqipengyuania halimionae]MXP10106.1 exopolysaccharide biosynthesis protein [Alteriqipengyuania halimionae]
MKTPHSVGDILDALEELASDNDRVSIADTVEAFGARSWGPLIMVPALIELTPIGGIPGVPTFLATVIALVAVQMIFGQDHLWMPGFVEDRCVEADKLDKASDKLRPIGKRLDSWFHGRWRRFTENPWNKIAGVLILLLCATVPPLELLPFASSAPMLAIACFGLALMVRDGLLMLVASGLALASLGFGTYMLMTGAVGSG